ncbi:MAG: hypothetical protein AAGH60_03310 [Pseudomonadota bacterium]
MLTEKRNDLASAKQKRLLNRKVEELSKSDADLYYRSTSYIAAQLKTNMDADKTLSVQEKALVADLSQRDIEVLLSHH